MSPSFALSDKKGINRAELCLIKAEPVLVLFDEKGKNRSWLTMTEEGGKLMLSDGKRVRILLTMTEEGPTLILADESGKIRAEMKEYGTDPGEAPKPVPWWKGIWKK